MMISLVFSSINAMNTIKTIFGFPINSVSVRRNTIGAIELMSTENKRAKTISTRGLVGCTATIFYAVDTEGNKHAIMSHFGDGHEQHIPTLQRPIQQLVACKKIEKITFVIVTPEEHDWHKEVMGHQFHCRTHKLDLERMVREQSNCSWVEVIPVSYHIAPPRCNMDTSTSVEASIFHGHSSCQIYTHWAADRHKITLE